MTGVYKIVNLINLDFYIGSSARNLSERFKKHYYQLSKNIHINKHLQNAVNKYGIRNFRFEIIEYCPRDICISREQYYLDILKPKYNKNPIAGSSLNIKHSEETKDKMRQKALGRPSPRKGAKLTQETINKISNSRKKDKVYHYDSNNNLLNIYPSVLEASKNLKITRHTLYAMIYKSGKFTRNVYKNDIFKLEKHES